MESLLSRGLPLRTSGWWLSSTSPVYFSALPGVGEDGLEVSSQLAEFPPENLPVAGRAEAVFLPHKGAHLTLPGLKCKPDSVYFGAAGLPIYISSPVSISTFPLPR